MRNIQSELSIFLSRKELGWGVRAAGCLKRELLRRNVTCEDLATRLSELGLAETRLTISNKLSKGSVCPTFLLAAFVAIGAEHVPIDDI